MNTRRKPLIDLPCGRFGFSWIVPWVAVALVAKVKDLYPNTARMIRTDDSDIGALLRSMFVAHQMIDIDLIGSQKKCHGLVVLFVKYAQGNLNPI